MKSQVAADGRPGERIHERTENGRTAGSRAAYAAQRLRISEAEVENRVRAGAIRVRRDRAGQRLVFTEVEDPPVLWTDDRSGIREVLRSTDDVQTPFASLQLPSGSMQTRDASLQTGFARLQKGNARTHSRFTAMQTAFADLRKPFARLQKPFACLQPWFAGLQKVPANDPPSSCNSFFCK